MGTGHKILASALLQVIRTEKNNGGGEFTLKSRATGKDYTFRLSRSQYNGKWYTHVHVEAGYMNFKYLGHYTAGKVVHKGRMVESPAAIAIAHVLRRVEAGGAQKLDTMLDVMHTGKCLKCGRPLTDADSIERGLGPVCSSL